MGGTRPTHGYMHVHTRTRACVRACMCACLSVCVRARVNSEISMPLWRRYLHMQNVLHLDLKSLNVLLLTEAGTIRAKVCGHGRRQACRHVSKTCVQTCVLTRAGWVHKCVESCVGAETCCRDTRIHARKHACTYVCRNAYTDSTRL